MKCSSEETQPGVVTFCGVWVEQDMTIILARKAKGFVLGTFSRNVTKGPGRNSSGKNVQSSICG